MTYTDIFEAMTDTIKNNYYSTTEMVTIHKFLTNMYLMARTNSELEKKLDELTNIAVERFNELILSIDDMTNV